MQEGLITVVVPVYNAEKYLNRCIDSILNQTYAKLELFLVNDGSTDGSGAICEEYVEKDSRVVYIPKENGGVSSARNLGIENANGEYITFVDSDDWIEPDSLEKLYASAKEYNADFVLPRTRYVMHDAQSNFIENDYDDDEFELIADCKEYSQYFAGIFNRAFSSTCGRLYSVKVLNKNALKFDEKIKVLEDLVFNICFLDNCKTVVKTDFVVYNFAVYDIGVYSSKRKYDAVAFGARSYFENVSAFLEKNEIEPDKKFFNLASDYWQLAIRNMLKSDGITPSTYKKLKSFSNEIVSEDLYNKCTLEQLDTDFKMLFKNGNAFQFLIVHYLKKLKAKLISITQR